MNFSHIEATRARNYYTAIAANDNVKDLEYFAIRTVKVMNERHAEEAEMLVRLLVEDPIRVERSRNYGLLRFYFHEDEVADRFMTLFEDMPVPGDNDV